MQETGYTALNCEFANFRRSILGTSKYTLLSAVTILQQ